MIPTRRAILMLSGATLAAAVAPAGVTRASNGVRRAISDFTGGKQPVDGGVRLDVPEIADNGGAVPVVVAAEGARRIALFADGNPRPGVVVFSFGRLAASSAATRMRLAESQTVFAVAEMADGAFRIASKPVLVTVGGCA